MELTFGEALQALRYQRRVRRCTWADGVWLRLRHLGEQEPHIAVHHPPHQMDANQEGASWLWHPSHSDLLANDWQVVKSE